MHNYGFIFLLLGLTEIVLDDLEFEKPEQLTFLIMGLCAAPLLNLCLKRFILAVVHLS